MKPLTTDEDEQAKRSTGRIPRIPDVTLCFEEAGVTITVSGRVLFVSHDEARALFGELAHLYGDA